MVDRGTRDRPVGHGGGESACHELLPAPVLAAASGVKAPSPHGTIPPDLSHFGPHEPCSARCSRWRAVANRRGCQGQPSAPGASPEFRRPGAEPGLVTWPAVPSARSLIRPGAGVHGPAGISLPGSPRAWVTVPLIAGILPSPLVISPLASSGPGHG